VVASVCLKRENVSHMRKLRELVGDDFVFLVPLLGAGFPAFADGFAACFGDAFDELVTDFCNNK